MKRIKRFLIKYKDGSAEETTEWPGQSAEHAIKRFQRARELSKKEDAQLIDVTEIKK